MRAINNIKLQINAKDAASSGGKEKTPKNKNTVLNNKARKVHKSPSDSTLYRPALKQKRLSKTIDSPDYIQQVINDTNNTKANQEKQQQQIDQFLTGIRTGKFPTGQPTIPRRMSQGATATPQRNEALTELDDIQEQQTRARKIAERAVLEAEKFKATVSAPTGKSPQFDAQPLTRNDNLDIFQEFRNLDLHVPAVDYNFNDDTAKNFCQVSNHIDVSTEMKIAKGAFLEMIKLTPPKNLKVDESDKKLELVSKEGKSFWLPITEKEQNKITNYRQWEQAFKVYAAVYTRYNPHRGAEIYQYVHSISLAASSFHWENVAYYDFHFRKLMGDNPQRSWAKTNTQLWSLAMRDPLPSRQNFHGNNNNNSQGFQRKGGSAE